MSGPLRTAKEPRKLETFCGLRPKGIGRPSDSETDQIRHVTGLEIGFAPKCRRSDEPRVEESREVVLAKFKFNETF